MINIIFSVCKWFWELAPYRKLSLFFLLLVAIRILFGSKFIEKRAQNLVGEIDFDRNINKTFPKIQKITNCDRVMLLQYVAEKRMLSGVPDVTLKMTHVLENEDFGDEFGGVLQNTCDLSCGVHDITSGIFDRLRLGVPSQFFIFIKEKLIKKRIIYLPNIQAIKESDIGIYKLLKDMQARACIIVGLYGAKRRVIGFLLIQYRKGCGLSSTMFDEINDIDLKHEVDMLNSAMILLKEYNLNK